MSFKSGVKSIVCELERW